MDYEKEKNYLRTLWAEKSRAASIIVKSSRPDLYNLINQIPGKTFSEKSWLWIAGLKVVPKCKNCQCTVKFLDFRRGYTTYCSTKCQSNSSDVQEKRKATTLRIYGKDHYSKTDEYKSKFASTCLDRYGVSNPGQINALKGSRSRKKQKTFFDRVIRQIAGAVTPKFVFDDYTYLRDHQLPWACLKCGEEFNSNLLDKLPECPKCFPKGNFGGPSSIEDDIFLEITKIYHGIVERNSRKIIAPKELDFYFPNEKFAIEVNGVYWHSDQQINKNYHQNKYKQCDQAGIRLLMITDHEWVSKRELVLSMIRHRLKISSIKVYARKCQSVELKVSQARAFLSKYHIHGFSPASKHYGLQFNGELVAVVSMATRNRFNKNKLIEIVRFATSITVVGAFGKILSLIKSNFPDSGISTYADLRYGNGEVYNKTGFTETHTTNPGYWYFINGKIDHRLNWSKSKLVKLGYPVEKTEFQIMDELKALRIYDCGHKHYEWKHHG